MSDERRTNTSPEVSHATPDHSNKYAPNLQAAEERGELLSRARNFLVSPQIIHLGAAEKHKFLLDKGLNESEIETLLRDLPPQRPVIPPRSYPQPPPSILPTLLLGISRVLSWAAGGSIILIFMYHRFLLPRIVGTTLARRSLRAHQFSLLQQLNASLASLKESQKAAFEVLPRLDPYKEPPEFEKCTSISNVLAMFEDEAFSTKRVPTITLLRCAIADTAKIKERESTTPTTTELFRYMEQQIPWLTSEEGLQYQETLWDTLSSSPVFEASGTDEHSTRWTYVPPVPSEPSPVMKHLNGLVDAMPRRPPSRQSPFQHTLQALSDFTGYLTTQIYVPYRATSGMGGYLNGGSTLNAAEEEFKKEVRALKGLILNRRTFMASPSVSTS